MRERDDFYRERQSPPETIDELFRSGNDEKPPASQRDKFFIQKCATTSFDKVQIRRYLIGAIDPEVEHHNLGEVDKFDATRTRDFSSAGGGRHSGELRTFFCWLPQLADDGFSS